MITTFCTKMNIHLLLKSSGNGSIRRSIHRKIRFIESSNLSKAAVITPKVAPVTLLWSISRVSQFPEKLDSPNSNNISVEYYKVQNATAGLNFPCYLSRRNPSQVTKYKRITTANVVNSILWPSIGILFNLTNQS